MSIILVQWTENNAVFGFHYIYPSIVLVPNFNVHGKITVPLILQQLWGCCLFYAFNIDSEYHILSYYVYVISLMDSEQHSFLV